MSTAMSRHTVEEYFEAEFASEERHEYVDGEILEMVGGSTPHNKIQMNLFGVLLRKFPPPSYRVCSENTRVKVDEPVSYLFPDATLVASPEQYEEHRRDTLLNPLIVFEILSPSTEKYNRGRKFELYQRINSLQHYVIISQTQAAVECFTRQSDGQWSGERFTGLNSAITFESLGWKLNLDELYQYIELPPE